MEFPTFLEQSVYHTVRYYNLFDQAVTVVQVWRCLALPPGTQGERWGGHRMFSLAEVQEVLRKSDWLRERVESENGFYVLRGALANVKESRARFTEAQMKWKQARKLARRLGWVSGVRMVAVSGSLAAGNVRKRSDIDLLVVTARGRIWITRLLVVAAAQLTGRRRKYWHKEAPGKLCLNHYISEDALEINPEIRNIYTAFLYHNLVALSGRRFLEKFWKVNERWMKQAVMRADPASVLKPAQYARAGLVVIWARRMGEKILSGKFGEAAEQWAEMVQRRAVDWHTEAAAGGRVSLSDYELAFHPGSKAGRIVAAFNRDEAQERLV